jgi:hypothetical protein
VVLRGIRLDETGPLMLGAPFVRPPGVAVVVDDARERPVTYLGRLPDGPIVVLEDTAAVIWVQAVAGEGPDVAAGVAASTGADVAEIRDSVEEFLAHLVAEGLLLRVPSDTEHGENPR